MLTELPRGYEPHSQAECKTYHHPLIKEIRAYPDQDSAALAAAHSIAETLDPWGRACISYATGQTMEPVYQHLASLNKDFSNTQLYHLDEYYPLSPQKPHSFVNFLKARVQGPLDIPDANCHYLDGLAQDPDLHAAEYELNLIDAYNQHSGHSLAILGIGPGGHIGFNESGSEFNSITRLVNLSQETISRDLERGQPRQEQALTQGIRTITHHPSRLLLIAYGQAKGATLNQALFDPTSETIPASALCQPNVGPKVTLIIDQAAASQFSTESR